LPILLVGNGEELMSIAAHIFTKGEELKRMLHTFLEMGEQLMRIAAHIFRNG
jgi:hypothetical protein